MKNFFYLGTLAATLSLSTGRAQSIDKWVNYGIADITNVIDAVNFCNFGTLDYFGELVFSTFNTIRPPNMELCLGDAVNSPGVASTSSRHQGGSHMLMADGAVKFFTDSMDAGDIHHGNIWLGGMNESVPGSASPYGTWGALGTRASREVIEQEF